jgi:ABC-type nitrate/sulfonate/bicarbonate transport system substrate-binding protein
LISPSYFPAEAAVALGFFANEGIDARLELISPIERAYEALRNGDIDIVAGSAHSALSAFPRWNGVKLICAQSQGMYWFLVMRADLGAKRGDLSAVKGRRIGAAPWVGLCFRQLLVESGIDLDRDDVKIMPTPGSLNKKVNFGVAAARALEEGVIDGFWANGMGAEIAVRSGVGTLVLDVRRGDGPKAGFNYTMATLATTDKLIAEQPEKIAGAVRAISATQLALRNEVQLAENVAAKFFPEDSSHIVELVRRDLPFYRSDLTHAFVEGMNRFARMIKILDEEVPYSNIVAEQFSRYWNKSR